MHPHTAAEDATLLGSQYGIHVRTVVSAVAEGMFTEEADNTGPAIPALGRGVQQLRPTLSSILGYEPFVSARVSYDLEQPVGSADIRLHLGPQADWHNIAPLNFYTDNTFEGGFGPYWDWVGRRRALLDTGIYVRLETKLVSGIPRTVIPPPPEIENIGPVVATVSPDGASINWPPHSVGRIGMLVIQSANETVTLDDAAGFVSAATAQGIGTTGSSTGVAWGSSTEFTGTANPTTASFTLPANTRGVVVWITQPITQTDFVTGVTIGGVAMTRIGTYVETTAQGGRVYGYFLGSGVPAAGAQTINVARSQTTTTIHVVAEALTGSANMEVVDSDGQAGFISNPSLTLQYGGRKAIGLTAMYSSFDFILSTSAERSGQTRVQDHDFGTETSLASRQTTPNTTDTTLGWTMNAGHIAQMAMAVAEVSGAATRIQTYWCRATTNNMPAPHVAQPGDHFMAFIYTIRNAVESGTPVNATGVGTEGSDTSVSAPAVTPLVARSLVINHVAIATAATGHQFSNWANPNLGFSETGESGLITYPALEKVDRLTDIGLGGGIGIYAGPRQTATSSGNSTATLATASVKAMQTLAISPQPTQSVVVNPADVPWRPFFVGRIDTVDPAEDGSDIVTLHCRDVYCDVLDAWVIPDEGENGVQFDSDQIEGLLGDLLPFAQSAVASDTIPFAVIGDPGMTVPAYYQEPMSVLLAMRQAGLQNGWDLRGRWGTSPFGENVYVLTYYEPDRELEGTPFDIGPSRYFEIGSFPLSRDDVRNVVEVIPGQPPRTPVRVENFNSQLDYGTRYLRLAYDKSSLIRTAAQAQTLAGAVVSDVSQPKVSAEIHTRFHPWVEINDLIRLQPNYVHHGGPLTFSISGIEHTLGEDGDGTTVIRTRAIPASASFTEWRRGELQKHIMSATTPSGPAPEGAVWSQTTVTETDPGTPPPPGTGATVPPTWVGAGNFAAATSAVGPQWPAGHRANDIGLLEVQTSNQALGSIPSGWAYIGSLPVGAGTAGAAGSTMAHWLWKRATSTSESAASIGDSGDHQVARIHLIRGALRSGSPINVASTPAVVSTAVTSVTMGGATTTVDNCLVFAYVANAVDVSTPQTSGATNSWVNADLTNKVYPDYVQTGQGNGGGMQAITGVKATAGAYGSTTTTLTTASRQVTGSFAIAPEPG